MTAAQLNRNIVADNLRCMTITPGMGVDINVGTLSVSIWWSDPHHNLTFYPIIQIDDGEEIIFHREGVESKGPFCVAWSHLLFDAADALEEVTA